MAGRIPQPALIAKASMEDLKLINQQFLGVWDIYIKFYTAFLTVNLAGLGLVLEKIKHGRARRVVGVAFMTQNLLSLGTAVGLAMYSHNVAGAFARHEDYAVLQAARSLGVWGGLANALSHILLILLWVAVLWWRRPDGRMPLSAGLMLAPTPTPPSRSAETSAPVS